MTSMSEHVLQQDSRTETRSARPLRGRGGLGIDGRSMLEAAVKRDVIPRLFAMSWVERASGAVDARAAISDGTRRKLVALCLEPNSQGIVVFVTWLHRSGVAAASICEDLFTPAARDPGVMWGE